MEAVSPTRLPRNVKLLGWVSLLTDVASEMIYPLLPQFLITVLGGNRFQLGVIEGVADSASSLLKLWSGAWSDRARSRKGFVAFGYTLAALVRPLIGLATAPWHLFAIRTADRVGKGIRSSPRDALIADSTDPSIRGRAYGFHRAMDHLGAAVGPLIATGFLLLYPGQLRPLFLCTLIPGLIVIGLVFVGVRDQPIAGPAAKQFKLTLEPFGPGFKRYLIALAIFTMGNSTDAFLLVRAGEVGVATVLLPLLWCAFHVVKSGGNLVAGRWVDRRAAKPFILAGWLTYAAAYVGFAFASEPWHIWALFLGYGLFHALTEPAEKTLVARLVGADRRGLGFGWYNFAIGIVALPSSVVFGLLYEKAGAVAAFSWGAGLAVVACAMLLAVPAVLSREQTADDR
jgi:MFS family permease